MTVRGTTCDVAGELVGITSTRIGSDVDHRIEINTDGQVNVRGKGQDLAELRGREQLSCRVTRSP